MSAVMEKQKNKKMSFRKKTPNKTTYLSTTVLVTYAAYEGKQGRAAADPEGALGLDIRREVSGAAPLPSR